MNKPSKIVCVGRNYLDHIREMGNDVPKEPLLFLKPASAIIHDGEPILLHAVSGHIEFEGEIGVLIGRRLHRAASESEARESVAGIVALNDVTARDLQRSDGQWTRAKGMDSFCPLGESGRAPQDLESLEIVTRLNGVEVQRASASNMVFSIPFLLAYISQYITLEPGDIVATGTPAGTRRLSAGDVVEVEIPGVSRVSNPVLADAG